MARRGSVRGTTGSRGPATSRTVVVVLLTGFAVLGVVGPVGGVVAGPVDAVAPESGVDATDRRVVGPSVADAWDPGHQPPGRKAVGAGPRKSGQSADVHPRPGSTGRVSDERTDGFTEDASPVAGTVTDSNRGGLPDRPDGIGNRTPDNGTFEPDDSFMAAGSVGNGTYSGLRIDVGDVDYYAVELTANDTLQVSIDFRHSRGDLDLTLYGPDREVVDSSISTTDGESVSVRSARPGTYYVKVYGYRNAAAPYRMHVLQRTVVNDGFEPNDGLGTATPVPENGTLRDLQVVNGESDFFSVNVSRPGPLRATVTFDDETGDLDLVVYGPDGVREAASTTTTDNESVVTAVETAGTHYLEVVGFEGASAPYALSVTPPGNATNGTDPGTANLTEARLEDGETYRGRLTADDQQSAKNRGYHDRITFEGTRGDLVTLTMATGTGDPYLILRGPNGSVLAQNDDGSDGLDARLDRVELPATGRYTVVATSRWRGATFPYEVSMTRTNASETDGHPLTLAVDPVVATPGTNVTLEYTLTYDGNETRTVILESGLADLPGAWELEGRDDGGGEWIGREFTWRFRAVSPGDRLSPSITVGVPESVTTPTDRIASVRGYTYHTRVVETLSVTVRKSGTAGRSEPDSRVADRNGE